MAVCVCELEGSFSLCGAGCAYQQLALGLTATALAVGGKVLPEEGVVEVATAVEVEQRRLGSGSGAVTLGLGLGDGLDGRVEAVDVGLVVLGVVKLHDLARDVGLERAIVVCLRGEHTSRSARQLGSRERQRELTREIRQSSLAADKGGAGHGGSGLGDAGAEAGAQGGSRSEERGGHGDNLAMLDGGTR